ncbi:M3 family oligoendopeptidase [Microaceticoccus formicicus]|uniref:M3 family oligoendopeptidase n=1 Tax=Microaceticoccus formicicus TaxID=3118105 RepID=UPI003CD000EF|nr:M3 family oligoendopeptidase [Peptoniphilaceae bacterium AMB_02]
MKKFHEIEYKRPDVEVLINSISELKEEFPNADAKRQIELVYESDRIARKYFTANTICQIRFTMNTADEFYKKETDFYNENSPLFIEAMTAFQNEVLESKYKDELEAEFFKQALKLLEMQKKSFDPSIVEDLVEENKTSNEYSELIGSAQIEYEGEMYTLSRLIPKMQVEDREKRKSASEAYYGFFKENMDKFDDIFDRLVKIRHRMAKKLGFKNHIELGYLNMNRSDYGPADVEVYRDAIVKYVVPYASSIYERQRQRLGLDKLKYYDEAYKFESGNPTPKGEPEWLIQRAKEMYSEMSPETKEFFDFMEEYELFDLVSRDGKMSGGYCTPLTEYKAQFIFANMNGTAHDVVVLTHEAGHALQVYLARNLPLSLYIFPTYEACEIHSMSMEFFTMPYMERFFKEDTEKYKYSHLAGTMEFIPYGALIDEFQHYVYENVDDTPEMRRTKFRELERKYLPHRDYEDNEFLESGGFFFRQNHVFLSPFYYIDYTLAQICAIGYLRMLKEDYDDAFKNYLDLCKLGGSKSFLELVESTGLPNPFEERTIELAVNTVKSYLDKIDDSQF